MSRKSELQEKFELALKKGLESESAVERTAAIKATADMLNPNLGELQTQLKQAQDRLSEAKTNLKETQDALAAANATVAELQPLAEKAGPLQAELDAIRAGQVEWRTEQVRALTGEATLKLSKAERAEREAAYKLNLMERSYSQGALLETFDLIRTLLEQTKTLMPSFWDASPTIVPVFWTLFGWSPAKAQVYTACKVSYPSCTPEFKQYALKILLTEVPVYEGTLQRDPIEHLAERRECVREMAQRWNCLDEIVRQVEAVHRSRAGAAFQRHAADMQSQEIGASRLGYGRQSLVLEVLPSTVPLSEHVIGCCCAACGGSGLPEHLREDLSLGTSTPHTETDLNEPRPMSYEESEL